MFYLSKLIMPLLFWFLSLIILFRWVIMGLLFVVMFFMKLLLSFWYFGWDLYLVLLLIMFKSFLLSEEVWWKMFILYKSFWGNMIVSGSFLDVFLSLIWGSFMIRLIGIFFKVCLSVWIFFLNLLVGLCNVFLRLYILLFLTVVYVVL